MSEKTMKKFVSLLLVFVMLVATITIVPFNTQAAEGSAVKRITVVKGKDINDIQYGGKNVLHSSAWWIDEDGTKYPAFCVDPNKAGPGEIAAGQYDLNISGAETNEKIAAIINNSIPYKTYQELGVNSEEEAYAATKAAIWCVIGVSNYTTQGLWRSSNQKVTDLFNTLVNLANSSPAPVQPAVYGSAKVDEKPVKEGDMWTQRYKVVETTNSGKEIRNYEVKLTNAPSGTKITDESGTEKNSFKGNELFKVWMPDPAVPEDGTVEAKFEITAEMFSNVILLGKPTDGLDGKVQDMEIAMPLQKVKMENNMIVGKMPENPPDTPTLLIEKYDEETGERLPGAQFAIYEQANTARPVAEGVTDANGEFGATLKPGTYVIKELNPPPGYMISDKTKPERVIVVKDSDEQITIKVDNIKLPKLTIRKIDSITKQPVAGAVNLNNITFDNGMTAWNKGIQKYIRKKSKKYGFSKQVTMPILKSGRDEERKVAIDTVFRRGF